MIKDKTIALIAHDRRKADMLDWVRHNAETLMQNNLVCTGTTGNLVFKELRKVDPEYAEQEFICPIEIVNSGPMGGDAQIAAMVAENKIDMCIFLIDDLMSNPHEADIQMLLRQCRIHNIPVACNRHSADLMITSTLWGTDYIPSIPTYQSFER